MNGRVKVGNASNVSEEEMRNEVQSEGVKCYLRLRIQWRLVLRRHNLMIPCSLVVGYNISTYTYCLNAKDATGFPPEMLVATVWSARRYHGPEANNIVRGDFSIWGSWAQNLGVVELRLHRLLCSARRGRLCIAVARCLTRQMIPPPAIDRLSAVYEQGVSTQSSQQELWDKEMTFLYLLEGGEGRIMQLEEKIDITPNFYDPSILPTNIFFSPGATTPIRGCILQPSSGL